MSMQDAIFPKHKIQVLTATYSFTNERHITRMVVCGLLQGKNVRPYLTHPLSLLHSKRMSVPTGKQWGMCHCGMTLCAC